MRPGRDGLQRQRQIGTTACSATGTLPATFQDCPTTGDTCLVNASGVAACIQCLAGSVACSGSTPGSTGNTSMDTCSAQNTWETPVACPGGETCVPASSFCKTYYFSGYGYMPIDTETIQMLYGSQYSCTKFPGYFGYYDLGDPEACGTTSDCCSDYCSGTPTQCE